jgi:tetratricopeptide (TPR) repeat protein
MLLVKQLVEHSDGDDVVEWVDRVEAGYPDLRSVIRHALDQGEFPVVWSLIAQMNSFLLLRGYRGEALEWLRRSGLDDLAADPSTYAAMPAFLRGGVLFAAGMICYYTEDLSKSILYFERAAEMFDEPSIPVSLKFTCSFFYALALVAANEPRSIDRMNAALAIARESGDRFLEGMALCYSHELHVRVNDLERAREDLTLASRIERELRRPMLTSSLHMGLGYLAAINGSFEEALREFDECLSATNNQRIAGTVGWAKSGAGYCLLRLGRPEEARQRFLEGLEASMAGGYRAAVMSQWAGLAWVALIKGDIQRAARLLGAADAQHHTIKFSEWTVNSRMRSEARAALFATMDEPTRRMEMEAGGLLRLEEVNALAMA